MRSRQLYILGLIVVMAGLCGCGKNVPVGYKARIKTRSGWSNTLHSPGRIACYGYDVMWIVETRETTRDTKLNILLQKDQVNFGVAVRFTLKDKDADVLPVFDKVRPFSSDNKYAGVITLDGIWDTYLAPVVASVPKQIIRPYTTEQILAESAKIEKEVQSAIIKAMEETPVKVRLVTIVNMDFPKFITLAQEEAKKEEIEIRRETNKQKKRLIEEQNKLKLKELEYQQAMLDGKKIADQNRLIGKSLLGEAGRQYLRWHEIRVYGEAAQGPNNCLFLPMTLLGGQGSVGATMMNEAALTIPREELRKAILPKVKNDREAEGPWVSETE